MTPYRVCYLDNHGRTRRMEVRPFDSDVTATAYARARLELTPTVEVWSGRVLVARIHRAPPRLAVRSRSLVRTLLEPFAHAARDFDGIEDARHG